MKISVFGVRRAESYVTIYNTTRNTRDRETSCARRGVDPCATRGRRERARYTNNNVNNSHDDDVAPSRPANRPIVEPVRTRDYRLEKGDYTIRRRLGRSRGSHRCYVLLGSRTAADV